MFVAMVAAFLLLEERDEGIGAFYQITPAAGYSYLTARIGLPMLWGFVMTILVTAFLNISGFGMADILIAAFISALNGISMAMMVVSLAGNRVEGLALAKLMAVSFLGLILIWFVPAPYSYLLAFLPSFWLGKIILDGLNIFSVLIALLICLVWIVLFTRRFLKRVI
jgi:fluoroquinolone transport system permease protein